MSVFEEIFQRIQEEWAITNSVRYGWSPINTPRRCDGLDSRCLDALLRCTEFGEKDAIRLRTGAAALNDVNWAALSPLDHVTRLTSSRSRDAEKFLALHDNWEIRERVYRNVHALSRPRSRRIHVAETTIGRYDASGTRSCAKIDGVGGKCNERETTIRFDPHTDVNWPTATRNSVTRA